MLVFGISCSNAPQLTLVEEGNSKYTIVLSEKASLSERYAAKELQKTLKKISSYEMDILSISDAPADHRIFVGQNPLTDSLLSGLELSEFGDEDFLIQTKGNDLFILGGKKRGTMYGVFTFLEDYLGCRWYTHEVIHDS